MKAVAAAGSPAVEHCNKSLRSARMINRFYHTWLKSFARCDRHNNMMSFCRDASQDLRPLTTYEQPFASRLPRSLHGRYAVSNL